MKKITNFSDVQTIGVDLHTTDVTIDEKKIRLHFWDTAGQEQFRSIIKNFYRGCAGAVLVYDTTLWSSFSNLSYWVKEIRNENPGIPLIMLGNKIDLKSKKMVATTTAKKFAEDNNITFCEITARDIHGVEVAIMKLITDVYWRYKNTPGLCLGVREYSLINNLENNNSSKCCNIF